jgi:hypothetical protein
MLPRATLKVIGDADVQDAFPAFHNVDVEIARHGMLLVASD